MSLTDRRGRGMNILLALESKVLQEGTILPKSPEESRKWGGGVRWSSLTPTTTP
jgi:hypothetical protein